MTVKTFKQISIDPKIKTHDGLTVEGRLYQTGSKKLVIIVHGLTAEYMFGLCKMGQEYFTANGFDTYLYNVYSDEEKDGKRPRALYGNLTLRRQVEDITDIFNHFKSKYDEIYLIGHSYGGITLVWANLPATAVSLWDPTYISETWGKRIIRKEGLPFISWEGGALYLVNEDMVNEGIDIFKTDKKPAEWAKQVTAPTQINKSESFKNGNEKYADYIKTSELLVYKTDHNFSEPDPRKALCDATLSWFGKWSNLKSKI